MWEKYPGHFRESVGSFQLVRDLDGRGRNSLLEVKQDGDTRYSAVPAYRHDSGSLEKLTITGPGFPEIEIHYSGDGGVADNIEYRVNAQATFTWSRERGAGGRFEGIAAGKPEFNHSWTHDAFGRVHELTRANGVTTYTYADNGSLARAQRAGEDREYVFSDRGELTQEKLNGQVLAANFDPNKSGAATFRENLRQFTLHGTAHAEATVRVYANTNLVSTATSPFAVTLTESHYPGMAQSNGPFPWKVTGERPGIDYIGEMAIADLEGEAWLPDAEKSLIINFGRRGQDSLLSSIPGSPLLFISGLPKESAGHPLLLRMKCIWEHAELRMSNKHFIMNCCAQRRPLRSVGLESPTSVLRSVTHTPLRGCARRTGCPRSRLDGGGLFDYKRHSHENRSLSRNL